MSNEPINKCQYWNKHEPLPCIYWDEETTVCNYRGAEDQNSVSSTYTPTHFPYCNLIGTSVGCSSYKSPNHGATIARCILPDPRRHVCNRATGRKWVTAEEDSDTYNESGAVLLDWQFDTINGYNNGACDGVGTNVTCSGYAPYHLGFGVLTPSDSVELDTFALGRFSIDSEFDYRLPTNFVIYNIRAALSKCYWWRVDSGNFIVEEDSTIALEGNWECSCPNDTSFYSEFTLDNGPPCNGCKPECPSYTGVCWKYCIDVKMQDGDPILAEQIHELRYYHRESNWTTEAIQSIFIDEGDIFTWHGSIDPARCAEGSLGQQLDSECVDGGATLKGALSTTIGINGMIEDYRIPAVKVTMPSFEEFTIETEDVELTQGTTVTSALSDFPTLVRSIQLLPLSPIIQTEFTKHTTVNNENLLLFETPFLAKDISVLIYGKLFYSKTAYAINISDSKVRAIIPRELYHFDDIYLLETTLGPEDYDIFKARLVSAFRALKALDPDKVIVNSLANEDLTFLMDVPVLSKDKTYNGSSENTILVFQEVNDTFTFDKISFIKRVVGGMMFQDDFKIIGDRKLVRHPIPNFEKSFMTNLNHNGSISFHFSPFIDAGIETTPAYTYNDVKHIDPLTGDLFIGSKKYKITIVTYLLEVTSTVEYEREFKPIGSNGYALIKLNDLYINNIIENWKAEKIVVTYENEVLAPNGTTSIEYSECEMEIVHHGGDHKMPSRCVLVKPRNIANYGSICGRVSTVKIINLTYIEKRSFEQLPELNLGTYEEVIEESDEVHILSAGTLEGSESNFIIVDYKFVLTLATIMKDSTGRYFTMSRTKPIGMVKQVACPDVEIFYSWEGKYTEYQNFPHCRCCGPWTETHMSDDNIRRNSPFCGDHFECAGCLIGPMWWPYNKCRDYSGYRQVTNLDNWDLEMRGLFQMRDDDGQWVHGAHDMRMLGPDKRDGRTGLYCPPRACTCPMLTYNYYLRGEAYFVGYGRVRAGVSQSQISIWFATGSDPILPFGNERRSVLRSYRTMDQAPYIRTDIDPLTKISIPRTDWKLMPAIQMFSRSDITQNDDEMWDYFCGSKGANVINPLGFYLADEFDGLAIDETVDYHNRFRFEDIIIARNEFNLGYPKTAGSYVVAVGNSIVSPWYDFKEYLVSGLYIQWAWQEVWKPLERNSNESLECSYEEFVEEFVTRGVVGNIKGTYLALGNIVAGLHQMIKPTYPKYEYDWQNKEFRLVGDESSEARIKFIAPTSKDQATGEYIGYPALQLNNGPKRGINWQGEWLTADNADGTLPDGETLDEDYNVLLYETCIGNYSLDTSISTATTWSNQVTLFDSGYDDISTSSAEDDDRMVLTIAPITGDKVKTYFQRGLNVELFLNRLGSAPLKVQLLTQLLQLDPFMEVVCGFTESLPIGFKFDNIMRTIGRVSFSYEYGPNLISPAVISANNTQVTQAVYSYSHMPEISIYKSSTGTATGATLLYKSSGMKLYDGPPEGVIEVKSETVEWENSWDYVAGGEVGLYVVFRTTPTVEEISKLNTTLLDSGRYNSSLNLVNVLNTQLYKEELTDAQENIKIWERKYYVSYGHSADGPPQGTGEVKTLTDLPMTPHSVWQVDSVEGVNGIAGSNGQHAYINKCRGRFVFDIHEDEELLDTGSIAAMENLQYELYNQAANKATTLSAMQGIMPPGLQKLLTDNGVIFGGAESLSLENSLISTLAEINNFPLMQAEGHSYIPSSPWTEGCGGSYTHSALTRCYGGDTFQWRYTNFDGDYDTDIFEDSHYAWESLTQFNMGTYWMLQRREADFYLADTVFPRLYSRNTKNRIFRADEAEFSDMTYPLMDIRYPTAGSFSVHVPARRPPPVITHWGGMFPITIGQTWNQ